MDKVTKDTEALKLGDSNTGTNGPAVPDVASLLPELPPGRTLNTGMTLEETLADLKKHPLFMTELDPSEDNEGLAALQALAYDGTPLENAANFKEQGNECFKEKRWGDAKEFYSKGVAILAAEEARRAKGIKKRVKVQKPVAVAISPDYDPSSSHSAAHEPTSQDEGTGKEEEGEEEVDDSPTETASERALLETLHLNRAACHLSLQNYRSCTLDCAAALRLNPSNVKALYRSARALLAVNKIHEADDACARGLELDPANQPLQALAQDIIKANDAELARRRREEERLARERQRQTLLRTALQARGIQVRNTGKKPDMEDARVRLVPDELDPHSSLAFPTMLLYPLEMESDFIKGFGEAETLDQHFGYVFPLPWDKAGEYESGRVECYMETVKGGLVKVGRKVPLLKVLSGGNVEVVDELLRVFVVPQGKAEGWVREWKAKKGEENQR
ncbi:Tetratricopeptide repeat protein 4 [Madurella mycetomatis]|uniref:Tetratricopeptide repeat protein 4 n=1 Tax=Madurella mycetomatis TaxID=100816 RepID=A0A175VTE7_9PEZI|nr:Tetratricopeptide repeat protein 4 [Madurella mycetomatis]